MLLTAPPLLLGALATASWARDADCPELHAADLATLVDQVDQLFVDQQVAAARRTLISAEKRLPCILEVVRKEDLARFAIRYAYVLGGDPEAERWAALAKALDPALPWPAYIPSGHGVRDLAADARPELLPVEDKGFSLPAAGGVFLDGRFLDAPRAEPGIPHLLQVGDAGGNIEASWMDGTAFPEDLLGPAAAPRTLPAWYSPDGTPVKVKKVREPWSEARLSNLERAAGFGAVGGALFGTATFARGAYDSRPTDALFATTDGATVAAGLAGTTSLVFLGAALFGR